MVIPIAFIVALWVGIDKNAGSFLATSRILVFFPFFLIGYYVKGEWVEKISKKVKIVGALFLTAVFVALLYYREFLSMLLKCVYGDKSYTAMGMTNVEGILYRSLWYLAATGMTVAFLCVVSSHKRFFTYIGAYTLPIYVIHRVLRDVFVMLGLYSAIGNGTLALIVCCVISIALVFFCASKGLAKVFNYAFQIGTIHKK